MSRLKLFRGLFGAPAVGLYRQRYIHQAINAFQCEDNVGYEILPSQYCINASNAADQYTESTLCLLAQWVTATSLNCVYFVQSIQGRRQHTAAVRRAPTTIASSSSSSRQMTLPARPRLIHATRIAALDSAAACLTPWCFVPWTPYQHNIIQDSLSIYRSPTRCTPITLAAVAVRALIIQSLYPTSPNSHHCDGYR